MTHSDKRDAAAFHFPAMYYAKSHIGALYGQVIDIIFNNPFVLQFINIKLRLPH